MDNSFERFCELPEALQKEAIREGEKLLDAQLTVANAADQRALTWGGFLLAGATAALGGGIALFTRTPANPMLGYTALLFAAALLRSAWLALSTVSPQLFCFPGNRPGLWLPDQWECSGTDKEKMQAARTDQARHLDKFIKSNMQDAERRAGVMRRSLQWAFWAVVVAGLVLSATVTARQWTIREPTSEIIDRS